MSKGVYILARRLSDGLLGPCKIGVAGDPAARAKDIQTACPFEIALFRSWRLPISDRDVFMFERQLHELLAEHRLQGEWFDLSPEQASDHVEITLAVLAVAGGVPPGDAPAFAATLREAAACASTCESGAA